MNLNSDITPEELKVFLEETDEQIELMDEDIVKLEKEGENPDLLQEIFRAAHTIKGSSAMVGHRRMAELTHAMESLLDKVRNGSISVSTSVIDALLSGLDAVRTLKGEITSSADSGLDIQPIVAMLNKTIGAAESRVESIAENRLSLDEDAIIRLQAAIAGGRNIYYLDIAINKGSEWAAVRCLQCLKELEHLGQIICSAPSDSEIDEEEVGSNIKILLATGEDKDTVKGTVSLITEIIGVEVRDYNPDAETGSNEAGSKEERSPAGTIDTDTKNVQGKTKTATQESSQSLQSVKVDVRVLDSLMNIVEELVIDRSNISQVGKTPGSKVRRR